MFNSIYNDMLKRRDGYLTILLCVYILGWWEIKIDNDKW